MNHNKYIQPSILITEIHPLRMLCGSIISDGDNLRIHVGGGVGDFGDDNTINTKSSDWDIWGE